MKNKNVLRYAMYTLTIVFLIIMIMYPSNKSVSTYLENEVLSAVIVEELEEITETNNEYETTKYTYLALITEGDFKNEIVKVEDNVSSGTPYHIKAEKNDEVLLYPEYNENKSEITITYISSFKRDKQIIYLAIIFIILLLLVGRMKGFKSLISLILTIVLVIKVFLPLILKGYDPILLSVLIAFIITIITILIVSDFSKKSLAAILGTLGGVLIGAIIAIIISYQAKIIGLSYEQTQFLMFIPQGTTFNFNGLLFSTILLGALGAVMDVSMSISSSIEEIKRANPYMSIKKLYKAGMNIGRDVMGTMINTLILAYTGSSMHLMLIILAYDMPFKNIINNDTIVTEIVRAFAGTIGIIIAIPLTALIAATLNKNIVKEAND